MSNSSRYLGQKAAYFGAKIVQSMLCAKNIAQKFADYITNIYLCSRKTR